MGAAMTQLVKLGSDGPQTFAPLLELDTLSNEAHSVVARVKRIRKLLEIEPNSLHEADIWVAELQALEPSRQQVSELPPESRTYLGRQHLDKFKSSSRCWSGRFRRVTRQIRSSTPGCCFLKRWQLAPA
jgi:hypothetical protein